MGEDEEYRELALEAWMSAIDDLDRTRDERRKRLLHALAYSAIPVWFVIDALVVWGSAWPGMFVALVVALTALAAGAWVRWRRADRRLDQLEDHVRRIDPGAERPELPALPDAGA